MFRKTLKLLHLWLSIPFGLIIVLMCLSGAILIFERDFGHIGQAEVDPNGKTPLPLNTILSSAKHFLKGKNDITGLTIYPEIHHAYKVNLAKPSMAAIWINQYTGEVTGYYERAEIFKFASSAHRRLFGQTKAKGGAGAKAGKTIIGITTIATLLIIISGLILWWPRKGEWRKKLKLSFRSGAYKFWYDFHCLGGFISSLILIICIITGLNWSFGWYRDAYYGLLGSEVAKSSSHKTPAVNYQAWDSAYQNIEAENTGKEIRIYQGEIDVMEGEFGNQQASSTYKFDPENGKIINLKSYSDKAKSNKIKGWSYSLHVGSWIGWFSKILYLICVLIGAGLPITGYYLWIKRLILKKRKSAN